MPGVTLREIIPGESLRERNKREVLHFGIGLGDPAPDVDGNVPKFVHWIPDETVVRDRAREASIRALLILEDTMDDLVIERPVREIRPSSERLMRDVCRSRVSQCPLEAIHELRFTRKTPIMREEDPFLPTGTVLVDLERVDAELGLGIGGRRRTAGERDRVVR